MLNVGSISSHKKQFINEASILRLRPYVIDEIGEDESFYLYQQCQKLLYHAFSRNMSNEVALIYTVKEHEEGNCQTAHCGRHKPHFDFGDFASSIAQSCR